MLVNLFAKFPRINLNYERLFCGIFLEIKSEKCYTIYIILQGVSYDNANQRRYQKILYEAAELKTGR